MNVLLINPTQEHALPSEAGNFPRLGTGPYPPLGLLYLQAAVEARQSGRAEILDANLPGTARRFDADAGLPSPPDIVGLTAMTPNLLGVVDTVRRVKAAWPAARVVIGGPHADLFPEESAGLPGVDFVLAGEGEESLPLLLDALAEGRSPESLPGIYSRAGSQQVASAARPVVTDLDALPLPDRSRIGVAAYRGFAGSPEPFTTMITSRGCPYRCAFCGTPRGKHRLRGVDSIVEEVDRCRALGIGHVYFLDDTFPLDGRRLHDLCDALARRAGLSWSCRTAAVGVTEDGLRAMKAAGCRRLQIGVETGTDEGLRVLGKAAGIDKMREAFRIARRAGIETVAYFMIGLPTERTPADVRATLRFAREIDPTYAMFNVLTLYPGTALFEEAARRGLVDGEAWRRFAREPRAGFVAPVWEEHLTRGQVLRLLTRAYRSFYWRPRVVARLLREGGGVAGFFRRFRIGLAMWRGSS